MKKLAATDRQVCVACGVCMKSHLKSMKRIIRITFAALLCLVCFAGCGKQEEVEVMEITYQQISAQEAKSIMDSGKDHVIIDARTEEEFAAGHIENAILIPEYEVADRAEQELPDKDALILVYCRSGRRSKIASEELVKLGYTNVKEFGGIIDWPYEITTKE